MNTTIALGRIKEWKTRPAQIAAARFSPTLQVALLLLVAFVCVPWIGRASSQLTSTLIAVIGGSEHGGDFITFYSAGQLYAARHDASPYVLDQLREAELEVRPELRERPDWVANKLNPFRNPPFYLPVVGYFAGFPLQVGFALTTAIQAALFVVLLVVTLLLIADRVSIAVGATWILAYLVFAPIWHVFEYAQLPAIIIVVAFAAGLLCWRNDRLFWAGLLFSLMWLKLQYVPPLVLFLLIRKEWKVLAGLSAGSTFLALTSIGLVGLDGMRQYIETISYLATSPDGTYFASFQQMHNWRGLLEDTPLAQQPNTLFLYEISLIGLTYVLAIWAWTARNRSASLKQEIGALLLALTMVLAGPHAHFHDLLLLLPVIGLVASRFWTSTSSWIAAYLTTGIVIVFFALLPELVHLTFDWKLSVVAMSIGFIGSVFVLRYKQTPGAAQTISRTSFLPAWLNLGSGDSTEVR